MARRYCHERQFDVEYMYKHDDAAREAQLEARLAQRSDEQFRALRKQLAAMAVAGGTPQNHSPNPRFVEEEDADYVEDGGEYPIATTRPRREGPMVRTYSRQWVSNFKFDIPEFNGCMQPHEFLDWVVAVEETLEFKEVPLGKQVPLVATKFRGLAAAWWQYLKQTRVRQGKEKIRSWKKLKKYMCSVFLPHNYTWIKPKKSGNMQSHSGELDFKSISLYTDSYVLANFSNKIFPTSSSKSQILKELILKAEVGKGDQGHSNNIGDIKELEEELGEIFLSTDTYFSESQYNCDLPPKYDEYPDDEYEICELSTVEGVHVAIEEIRRTTLPKENASEASPLPINVVNVMDIPALGIKFNQEQVEEEYANYFTPVEESNIQQEPRSAFANGSCVFSDSYIPPIIRCDKPNVIKGFSFQDGKVTEDGNWVFCGGAWDDSSLVVAFYRNVDKGTQLIGRINLRFKADADNQRRAKLLKQNSRTSFFQPGETDAG